MSGTAMEGPTPDNGLANPFFGHFEAVTAVTQASFMKKGAEAAAEEVTKATHLLAKIHEESTDEKGKIDFSRSPNVHGASDQERANYVLMINSNLTGASAALDALRARDQREHQAETQAELDGELKVNKDMILQVPRMEAPGSIGGDRRAITPLASQVFEKMMHDQHGVKAFSNEMRDFLDDGKTRVKIDQPIFDSNGRRVYAADGDTFERDHWDPNHQREPWWIAMKPTMVQVAGIFNELTTGTDTIRYMEETTHSNVAAERSESAAAPKGDYALTERSTGVTRIAHMLVATEEALSDGTPRSLVRSYLNYVLPLGVWNRLDSQLIKGNGTDPNLKGMLNYTLAKQKYTLKGSGAENPWNVLLKSAFSLMNWGSNRKFTVLGAQKATHVLLNPNIWRQCIESETTAGGYYVGGPQSPIMNTAWGMRVVPTDHLVDTASTDGANNHKIGGIVGDFSPAFSGLWYRHGVRTEIGMNDTNFEKFQVSLRCSIRVAFALFRTSPFLKLVNSKSDGSLPSG